MNFVEKVDALDVNVVILGPHDIRVILKLLNIDYRDFRPACVVVKNLRCFNVASKGVTSVDGVHDQAATRKLPLRLNQQIDSINDKVELGNNTPTLEVV